MGDERTYTQAERDQIIAEIRAGLEAGKRVAVTAKELGIKESTFYRWLREQARSVDPTPTPRRPMRPVRAAGAPRVVLSEARKREIVAAIRRRVAAGERVEEAARAEGVSPWSYYDWARRIPATKGAGEQAPLTMRPVALVPEMPAGAGGLTLVAPGGYRVEGLDVARAAALLRALT